MVSTRWSLAASPLPRGNLVLAATLAVVDELHAQGNTIILVTHEPDIAEYAHRVVTIRDGVIAGDHLSTRIRNQQ